MRRLEKGRRHHRSRDHQKDPVAAIIDGNSHRHVERAENAAANATGKNLKPAANGRLEIIGDADRQRAAQISRIADHEAVESSARIWPSQSDVQSAGGCLSVSAANSQLAKRRARVQEGGVGQGAGDQAATG